MPKRSLLALPEPRGASPPPGPRGGSSPRFPSRQRQLSTYGPEFRRLRQALARKDGSMALRTDPGSSCARSRHRLRGGREPGGLFRRLFVKSPDFEFLGESSIPTSPQMRTSRSSTRGKKRKARTGPTSRVPGRFYLTMPDCCNSSAAAEPLGAVGEMGRSVTALHPSPTSFSSCMRCAAGAARSHRRRHHRVLARGNAASPRPGRPGRGRVMVSRHAGAAPACLRRTSGA